MRNNICFNDNMEYIEIDFSKEFIKVSYDGNIKILERISY